MFHVLSVGNSCFQNYVCRYLIFYSSLAVQQRKA
jgi:hypothetical protein